jgi:cyclopropane-fatty-acyl-phospholipid synthase
VIRRLGAALQADLSVRLWTGETIPLGPDARADLCLVVAGPDALKRFLLAPGVKK